MTASSEISPRPSSDTTSTSSGTFSLIALEDGYVSDFGDVLAPAASTLQSTSPQPTVADLMLKLEQQEARHTADMDLIKSTLARIEDKLTSSKASDELKHRIRADTNEFLRGVAKLEEEKKRDEDIRNSPCACDNHMSRLPKNFGLSVDSPVGRAIQRASGGKAFPVRSPSPAAITPTTTAAVDILYASTLQSPASVPTAISSTPRPLPKLPHPTAPGWKAYPNLSSRERTNLSNLSHKLATSHSGTPSSTSTTNDEEIVRLTGAVAAQLARGIEGATEQPHPSASNVIQASDEKMDAYDYSDMPPLVPILSPSNNSTSQPVVQASQSSAIVLEQQQKETEEEEIDYSDMPLLQPYSSFSPSPSPSSHPSPTPISNVPRTRHASLPKPRKLRKVRDAAWFEEATIAAAIDSYWAQEETMEEESVAPEGESVLDLIE